MVPHSYKKQRQFVQHLLGGGGYLSTVRGTGTCHFLGVLFQTITELWVSFSQFFDISRNYGCPFQWIFHNFRNYGPDIYSICEIMALKSTRIHGIMGTDFLSKMARPRHVIGRVTPPPPPREYLMGNEQVPLKEVVFCAILLMLLFLFTFRSGIPLFSFIRFFDFLVNPFVRTHKIETTILRHRILILRNGTLIRNKGNLYNI